MSTLHHIIPERPADIGNFLVGRLLPFREKRMVGPFIFIDHMGPASLSESQNMDVGPHPHIGLSTLTYLFDGAIQHRDSLGYSLEIVPGQVNWMTAGKGIVHSERTPDRLRNQAKTMHGLQIWVALPKALEQMEPQFFHTDADALPTWKEHGAEYKLIAGKLNGIESPVPVHSPLYFLEIKNNSDRAIVNLGSHLYGESGIYVLQGGVEIEGNTFETKQLLVTTKAEMCQFSLLPNSIIYIFGGEPFPEERHIFWNFVSSDPTLIEAAKQAWKDQTFPKIEGEVGFVPLPEPPKFFK